MTKGSYSVGENNTQPPRKDTSFRSFICVLLIFLLICLIILLASIGWGKTRRHQPALQQVGDQSPHKGQDAVEVVGKNRPKSNETHEKMKYEELTTSTRRSIIIKEEGDDEEFDGDKEEVTEAVEVKVTVTEPPTTTKKSEEIGDGNGVDKEEVTEVVDVKVTVTELPTTTRKSEEIGNGNGTDKEEVTEAVEVKVTVTEPPTTTRKSEEIGDGNGVDKEEVTEAVEVKVTVTEPPTTTRKSEETGDGNGADKEEVTEVVEVKVTVTEPPTTTRKSEEIGDGNGADKGEETKVVEVKVPITEPTTTMGEKTGADKDEVTEAVEPTKMTKKSEEIFGEDEVTEVVETSVETTPFVTAIRNSKEETIVTKPVVVNETTTKKTEKVVTEVTTKSEKQESVEKLFQQTEENSTESTTKNVIEYEETILTTSIMNDQKIEVADLETTKYVEPTTIPVQQNESLTTTTTTTQVTLMESDFVPAPLVTSLTKTKNPVCDSKVCRIASSQILGMMDHSTEPCVDFYEFACGGANQLKTESTDFDVDIFEEQMMKIDSSSPKFIQGFKEFYLSCLEYEDNFFYKKRMEGIERLLGEVGEFWIVDSAPINLTELVSLLIMRQSMPLFDIGIDVDTKTAEFILQLNIPHQSFLRTGINRWSGLYLLKDHCLQQQKSYLSGSYINLDKIYQSYQDCQKNYASYLDAVENVIRDLSAFSNLGSALEAAIKEIRFDIEFEILNNLDKLPSQEVIMMDFVNKNYVLKTISELQADFPIFDWANLFGILTGREVDKNTYVQVYFVEYFQNIFKKLIGIDKRKLNNAFLAIYAYDLFVNTVVPKQRSHRNDFCIDMSKKLLPDIFSYSVSKVNSDKELGHENNKIKKIFQKLQNNFCSSLFDADWVDRNSRMSVIQKCRNLNLTFYEPPNENSLIKNFENVTITRDYQLNVITLLENLKKRIYSLAGTPLEVEKVFSYFLDPVSPNPKTFYASPLIIVPLGLSRRAPDGLPNYLVQTRAGFALARQLAHHFDPTGIRYGLKLVSTAKYTYKELVMAMETLMDDESPRVFQNKNISFRINGSLSINERIVDNAAFKLIFDSVTWNPDEDILPWISSDYSREKVFFIATAQEFCKKTTILDFMLQVFEERHLPAVLRVKNIMGNSKDFVDNFACPEGSSMELTLKIQFPFLEPIDYPDEEEEQNIQEK